MSNEIEHPLKEYFTGGSVGAANTRSNNDVSNQSKTVNTTGPSYPYYRELMKTLENAKSFCDETGLIYTNLNNKAAEEQFILDLYQKCPNIGEKPIKDILEVMIDVLHKYYMGFNTIPILGRKSYSGHGESIMITCVKYLFGIAEIGTVENAASSYRHKRLTRSQCRVKILHFYEGPIKKIMSAEEFLLILGIELVIKEELEPVKI